jgi:hypothetical protein
MGYKIRAWKANVVYTVTIRCNDQQFFLKPDHDPKRPLLAAGCEANTLDVRNKNIPHPSVINIIGAAFALAQSYHPIKIHWIEANINHLTIGFSVSVEQIGNISNFFQVAHGYIAQKLNTKWTHRGHIWGKRYHAQPCLDDRAAEQQFLYCLTNPVKDGLVSTMRESPFFTCYRNLVNGTSPRFWMIDWNAFDLAGGLRKKSHQPKDYLKWLELELSPLPHQAEWPDHKRQSWLRAAVREMENATAEDFRREGRRSMGVTAQYQVDPRDRPKNPKDSGPQPLCHSSSLEDRIEYARQWRELRRAHREASIDYLNGDWEREFPEGTFRPPLIKPYGIDRL